MLWLWLWLTRDVIDVIYSVLAEFGVELNSVPDVYSVIHAAWT